MFRIRLDDLSYTVTPIHRLQTTGKYRYRSVLLLGIIRMRYFTDSSHRPLTVVGMADTNEILRLFNGVLAQNACGAVVEQFEFLTF